MSDFDNGWKEWSKFVLKELERLSKEVSNCNSRLQEIKVDLTMLKVKSGVWGMVGAMIPICISLAIVFIQKAGH